MDTTQETLLQRLYASCIDGRCDITVAMAMDCIVCMMVRP